MATEWQRSQGTGRVSLQARHLTEALPEDERIAVTLLETHLFLRREGPHDAFEILPDGTPGIFLTTPRVQLLLRLIGSRQTGRDFPRKITREILPRLGLLQDTGLTKKPRARTGKEGGRHAQRSMQHSFWWPLHRIPPLTRLTTPRFGAYPKRPGSPGH